VLGQGGNGAVDEITVVPGNRQLHARRQRRTELAVEAPFHLAGNGHGIGVADLDDAQPHRHLAGLVGRLATVLATVLHLRHVLEQDSRAFAVPDHQALHFLDRVVFLVQLDQVFGLTADQETTRQLQMLVGQCGGDVLRRDAQRRGALQVDIDADGALLHAAQLHLAHAIDGFQALLEHRAGVGRQLRVGPVALQRQPHDGL